MAHSRASWLQREQQENQAIMKAWWDRYVVPSYNEDKINKLKEMVVWFYPSKDELEKNFSLLNRHAPDFNNFYKYITHALPSAFIWGIDNDEKLGITGGQEDHSTKITAQDLEDIEKFKKESGITGTFCVGCISADEGLHSPKNQPNAPYSIHSIGKVLTGVLLLKLVEEGIIPEKNLKEPIKDQMSLDAWNKLPPEVKKHLEDNLITLHQVMTHHGGIGDYLDNYWIAIDNAIENKAPIPTVNQPEDFLKYADSAIFKDKKSGEIIENYSNLGIILVGLVIKQACKDQKDQGYQEIVEKNLLEEIGIVCESHMPKNAVYNRNDKRAPFVVGGPAGGSWMTAEDLAKFGKWLYQKYSKDVTFKRLLNEYGQEFCYPQSGKIMHDGHTPYSNAHFAIYLKDGIIVTALSDQPRAAVELGYAIKRHIFCNAFHKDNEEKLQVDQKSSTARIISTSGVDKSQLTEMSDDNKTGLVIEKNSTIQPLSSSSTPIPASIVSVKQGK